jgi:hypothetical protein
VHTHIDTFTAAGGHPPVRRLVRLLASLLVVTTALSWNVRAEDGNQVNVVEKEGTYHVTATFAVPQSIDVVTAVLTDYEQVPKFMPNVRTSVILDREPGRTFIQQEVVAKWFLFSKHVRLLLEVLETPGSIQFKDTSRESFWIYEGGWTLTVHPGHTTIGYVLRARPSFSVPGFLLPRLMKNDADAMIDGLRVEMARRGGRVSPSPR